MSYKKNYALYVKLLREYDIPNADTPPSKLLRIDTLTTEEWRTMLIGLSTTSLKLVTDLLPRIADRNEIIARHRRLNQRTKCHE